LPLFIFLKKRLKFFTKPSDNFLLKGPSAKPGLPTSVGMGLAF